MGLLIRWVIKTGSLAGGLAALCLGLSIVLPGEGGIFFYRLSLVSFFLLLPSIGLTAWGEYRRRGREERKRSGHSRGRKNRKKSL
ncbi:hypothetical protein [Salinithrix halophila]|uniref:hypothetical protein n=1 Tax=Salinithrix halophila TaxID=1485204 RepID=UPI0036D36FD6